MDKKSKASTVAEYLEQLPEDRRNVVGAMRKVVRRYLPKGYKESIQYGSLAYVVTLEKFTAGYLNRKIEALPYICLASQKNYISLHLMGLYGDGESNFRKDFKASGKRLDMGKCCVRFRSIDDLPLDVVGKAISRFSVDQWVAWCQKAWDRPKKTAAKSNTTSKKNP